MTHPDPTSDEAIAQYREGLRAAGRNQRLAGFGLVVVGALVTLAARYAGGAGQAVQWVGYALVALGWALTLAGYFLRTRYQRRRMAELD